MESLVVFITDGRTTHHQGDQQRDRDITEEDESNEVHGSKGFLQTFGTLDLNLKPESYAFKCYNYAPANRM